MKITYLYFDQIQFRQEGKKLYEKKNLIASDVDGIEEEAFRIWRFAIAEIHDTCQRFYLRSSANQTLHLQLAKNRISCTHIDKRKIKKSSKIGGDWNWKRLSCTSPLLFHFKYVIILGFFYSFKNIKRVKYFSIQFDIALCWYIFSIPVLTRPVKRALLNQ